MLPLSSKFYPTLIIGKPRQTNFDTVVVLGVPTSVHLDETVRNTDQENYAVI
jgi:nicotinamidase-related amidase